MVLLLSVAIRPDYAFLKIGSMLFIWASVAWTSDAARSGFHGVQMKAACMELAIRLDYAFLKIGSMLFIWASVAWTSYAARSGFHGVQMKATCMECK
ncbi:hypothetical protein Dimus_022583 [Dionaea muscipula]